MHRLEKCQDDWRNLDKTDVRFGATLLVFESSSGGGKLSFPDKTTRFQLLRATLHRRGEQRRVGSAHLIAGVAG